MSCLPERIELRHKELSDRMGKDHWLDFQVVTSTGRVELWLHSSDNGWVVQSHDDTQITFIDGNGDGPFTEQWRPYQKP